GRPAAGAQTPRAFRAPEPARSLRNQPRRPPADTASGIDGAARRAAAPAGTLTEAASSFAARRVPCFRGSLAIRIELSEDTAKACRSARRVPCFRGSLATRIEPPRTPRKHAEARAGCHAFADPSQLASNSPRTPRKH